MTIRELLQIELWSKRTTRKILVGIGIVVAGYFAWAAVDEHWISPGEHRAGSEALVQIETLRKIDPEKDKDFELGVQQVRQKIEAAKKAAWTTRDTFLALDLSGYLLMTEIDRKAPGIGGKLQQRNASSSDSRRRLLEKLASTATGSEARLSARLHEELD
ncbi:MAG: hypothetical protein ABR860_12035 [Terracidiphilus sp.]